MRWSRQTLASPLISVPLLIPALSSLPVRQQQFLGGSPIAGKPAGPFPAAGAGTLWGGRPLGRRSGHGQQALPCHSLGPGVEQSRRGVKHRRGFAWHFCSRRGALKALRVQGGCRKDTGKIDAPGETDLPGLQLPALCAGCIANSSTLERAEAAFFRTCVFTYLCLCWEEASPGAMLSANDAASWEISTLSADLWQGSPYCRCSQGQVLHQSQN